MPPPIWFTKAFLCLALVAYALEGALHGTATGDLLAGQLLVFSGALLSLGHYVLLKRRNVRLDEPEQLVVRGGLFPLVRHPMYLGDMLTCAGLALMRPSWVSLALVLAGWAAVVLTARHEERALAERFGSDFEAWQKRSRLLVPFVL